MKVTIILADDHVILREGLRGILSSQPDLQVVNEASTGREAVELAAELCPDLMLMDIGMPDLNGVDATRKITTANSRIKVIALSMHCEREFVLAMLEAGARGYVVKSCASNELLQAVRAVLNHEVYLCSAAARAVVDSYNARLLPGEHSCRVLLTTREREVLQPLAEGKTSRDIARALAISAYTVDVHRRNIMQKLNLHTVAELTKYAIREGLTST